MTFLHDDNRMDAAESGLLGSILLSPNIIHDVLTRVRAADFRDSRNRTIFEHLVRVFARENGTIEIHAVATSLLDAGEFERAGGTAYLKALWNTQRVRQTLSSTHGWFARTGGEWRSCDTVSTQCCLSSRCPTRPKRYRAQFDDSIEGSFAPSKTAPVCLPDARCAIPESAPVAIIAPRSLGKGDEM